MISTVCSEFVFEVAVLRRHGYCNRSAFREKKGLCVRDRNALSTQWQLRVHTFDLVYLSLTLLPHRPPPNQNIYKISLFLHRGGHMSDPGPNNIIKIQKFHCDFRHCLMKQVSG